MAPALAIRAVDSGLFILLVLLVQSMKQAVGDSVVPEAERHKQQLQSQMQIYKIEMEIQ